MNDTTTSLAIFALVCIIAMIGMSLFIIVYFMMKVKRFSRQELLFYIIFVILILTVNITILHWYFKTLSEFLITEVIWQIKI